ncbi:phytanoyl-CoA dioxygenase family protein [Flavihumibacter sp. UBA7668]|uniref:phytanoyl-CoA dioxygenase family protein n=1 Tax=Flavihumibacter sp. UBA7668 TaxID=1946542 RepID=UPI0025BA5265|nr:phytanoyl-CoA dioxygenase family protein [Flavihumibacter sp. UBA7668]
MKEFEATGFEIINEVYTDNEIQNIQDTIHSTSSNQPGFLKSTDLFAIRQFLKEIPACFSLLFNNNLKTIISSRFGKDYFIVKSIYFDKPADSNWFVAYHQDLTISVDKKVELKGYGPWTTKQNQFAVQPPIEILEDNFTIRIHLDAATEENGALKVLPGSHLKGVVRTDQLNLTDAEVKSCNVNAGGIMLMKPLLLHASGRTTNKMQRRVIHLEFSRTPLPAEISWSEKQMIH